MQIIAVANPKGGGGKTTIVANLSAAMKKINDNLRILIVDLDGIASLTWWMLCEKGHAYSGPTIVDALLGDKPLEEIWQEVPSGVFVVPCSIELERVERRVPNDRLAEVLDSATDHFDYVILDLSQGYNNIHRMALKTATRIFISAEVDWLSLFGITGMIRYMKEEGITSLSKIDRVIPTKVDLRPNKTIEILESLKAFFPGKLAQNTIRVCAKLGDCPSYHCSIFDLDPTSTGAEDFIELAKEVLGIEEPDQPRQPRQPVGDVAFAKRAPVRQISG